MTDIPDRIRELQEPMLKKRLYVVFYELIRPVEEMVSRLPDHLDYMIGLEQRGAVFASGPFLNEAGGAPGRGMTVLRAESEEEAEALAQGDPLCKAGIRTYEVVAWQIMEGSFSVRINYSDGTYEFD
ncbi:MAG: YciI family protein [Rubrobacteraceae bacterium]